MRFCGVQGSGEAKDLNILSYADIINGLGFLNISYI